MYDFANSAYTTVVITAVFGAGYDSVDMAEALRRNIMVTSTPGASADAAAIAAAMLAGEKSMAASARCGSERTRGGTAISGTVVLRAMATAVSLPNSRSSRECRPIPTIT